MRKYIVLLTLLAGTTPLSAQLPGTPSVGERLADRVIAVVGDTAILSSDLEYEVSQYRAAGQMPTDSAEFEVAVMDLFENKINDLILVSAARDAAITVSEDRVNEVADQELARIQQQFGSELAFTQALALEGLTRDQIRRDLAARVRDRQLVQDYIMTRMRNRARPVISESEIQAAFDRQAAMDLGQRPATVSFRQVLITPEPSEAARNRAIARGDSVLAELRTGGDFEVLARRFSDDPGSREHGGDLGWFGADRMVAEFSRAAFNMRPGDTSGLVESPFGFHIIRVDRARGAERQARHILIQPEITEADVQAARVRADSVASSIRGGASMPDLAARYNEPSDQATVNRVILDGLPAEYKDALANAAPNTVVGPIAVPSPRGSRWAVIRVTEQAPAGEYTLDDVRDQIRENLQQQSMIEQLLTDLRARYYVNVLQ